MKSKIKVCNAESVEEVGYVLAKVDPIICRCGRTLDGVQVKVEYPHDWCIFALGICKCGKSFKVAVKRKRKIITFSPPPKNSDGEFEKFQEKFENADF